MQNGKLYKTYFKHKNLLRKEGSSRDELHPPKASEDRARKRTVWNIDESMTDVQNSTSKAYTV